MMYKTIIPKTAQYFIVLRLFTAFSFFLPLSFFSPQWECDAEERYWIKIYVPSEDVEGWLSGRLVEDAQLETLISDLFSSISFSSTLKRISRDSKVSSIPAFSLSETARKPSGFQGIAKIESFIGKLPTEIIMELLNRYQVHLIVNNAVIQFLPVIFAQ